LGVEVAKPPHAVDLAFLGFFCRERTALDVGLKMDPQVWHFRQRGQQSFGLRKRDVRVGVRYKNDDTYVRSERLRMRRMKTKLVTAFLLATGGFLPAMIGQTPSTPAPAVSASTNSDSEQPVTAPNQVVYAARLPTAQELTDAAAAHGTTISRIEQTSSQITATYQLGNGKVNVVSYQLLPAAGSGATAQVVTTPPPAVVYVPSPRVVYVDSYRTYDPWYWYPPVSLSIGLGFRGGYGHGGFYRGGFGHGFYHGHR